MWETLWNAFLGISMILFAIGFVIALAGEAFSYLVGIFKDEEPIDKFPDEEHLTIRRKKRTMYYMD